MHFSLFDSRPTALFCSTFLLSDGTSRPGVYQLIAHCSRVPLCANEIFFFFGKWVMHVFSEVPLIEGGNYSQVQSSGQILGCFWQPAVTSVLKDGILAAVRKTERLEHYILCSLIVHPTAKRLHPIFPTSVPIHSALHYGCAIIITIRASCWK